MEQDIITMLRRIEALALIGAKNVLTVEEVALYLGKSRKTIYNILDELPHYKNGRGVYFRKSEIEDWCCQVKCTPVNQIIEA